MFHLKNNVTVKTVPRDPPLLELTRVYTCEAVTALGLVRAILFGNRGGATHWHMSIKEH
jgi:hypothetical protein